MIPLAVGSTVAVLAVIGLVVGLVVLVVVINLLHGTLAPLREVLADVQSARTAPMLERGVPGTEQLGQTRRLAESVPALALAYLQRLSLGGARPASSPAAAPVAAYAAPPPPPADVASVEPAWKRYRS